MVYRHGQDNGRWGYSPEEQPEDPGEALKRLWRDKKKLIFALVIALAVIAAGAAVNNVVQKRQQQQAWDREMEEILEHEAWLESLPPEVRYYEQTKDFFYDRKQALDFGYEVCGLLDDWYAEDVMEFLVNPRPVPSVQGTVGSDRLNALLFAAADLCPEHHAEVGSAFAKSLEDATGIELGGRPGG